MSNNTNNDRERQSQSWISSGTIALAAAVIGGAAGAAYMFSGGSKKKEPEKQQKTVSKPDPKMSTSHSQSGGSESSSSSVSSYLSDMVSRIMINGAASPTAERNRNTCVPDNPCINNLNALLGDIHVRYIRLKEFTLHYKVFDGILQDLHKKMKEVDPYYRKYSSTVQFAGSHYDNLRIKKPDEFDMDIVIGLPLNIKPDIFNPANSDIILEPKSAGFVQLKMGIQFQQLPMRDNEEWLNNKAAYKWKDDSNYLLRSNFINWFKGVVYRALDQFKLNKNVRPIMYVEGVPYVIDTSESGPAITLLIHNKSRNFKLDVDLVPALKFPENRWPISKTYRPIPDNCKKDYWMVVPKPNKETSSQHDQMRSWRIALHNQERELMYNSYNLRQAIRFMKKLRDAQGMKKIASYYIKTLFLWEIVKINNESYWRNSYATLFKQMVKRLHEALVEGRIPYFWNNNNNLIGAVPRDILAQYAKKLVPLMEILEDSTRYKLVAKYLLTPEEFREYNAKYLHL